MRLLPQSGHGWRERLAESQLDENHENPCGHWLREPPSTNDPLISLPIQAARLRCNAGAHDFLDRHPLIVVDVPCPASGYGLSPESDVDQELEIAGIDETILVAITWAGDWRERRSR